MCARRFLFIVFFLTLLAVGAAFALFQFGGNVLLRQATPKGHFQAPAPLSGPNYEEIGSWLARPGLPNNPAEWLPAGRAAEYLPDYPATVFYIHPTTYLRTDRWNAPVSGSADSDARAELFVRSQASAFNSVGEIWAPRYRQAAFGAFLLKSEDAAKALDLAYSDVEEAFRIFLSSVPAERPMILAAHSQGALHLSRLLEKYGDGFKGRILAAYVVGWPLSVTADLPKMNMPACTRPDQFSCILSWQSFGEPANAGLILDAWQGTRGPTGVTRERKDMLCVNPLTGTRDGAASPQANPGTLVPSANLTSAALASGQVGARCDTGFLLIDGQIPALGPYVLPGNNYHVYDYALFWEAIRRDAQRRLQAYNRL